MNVDQEFPKRFITSTDVESSGGPCVLRIKSVVLETIGTGNKAQRKLVLSFFRTAKQLALNVRNRNIIAQSLGGETDDWLGHWIRLEVVPDAFEGRPVRSILVAEVKSNADVASRNEQHVPDDGRTALPTDQRVYLTREEVAARNGNGNAVAMPPPGW